MLTGLKRGGGDLHVHTTHSDGTCTPGDVVRAAAGVGLSALAITDHDTLSAIPMARPEAARLGIELINGIELTAEFEGREIHLLGHLFRDDDAAIRALAEDLRRRRAERIARMTERLRDLGLRIDLAGLRATFPRATLGRRHLADHLVRTRQVGDRREAFARFLGDQGPIQVPKPRVPWRDAIEVIRNAGGVAGLAHPPYDLTRARLESLCAAGLGAIEVRGPGINTRLGRRWRDWAADLDLVPIAGSDFHAPDRPGQWVGSVTTTDAELERLRSLAEHSRPTNMPAISTGTT